ncbi:MAG: hypothetical protein ACK4N5_16835, partial [Myxococcales bacterium]
MSPPRAAFVSALLLLAACTDEIAVPSPPVVVAGRDIDADLAERIALVATAADGDGTVEKFEWSLVAVPDGADPSLVALPPRGEVAELLPKGVSGLYVIAVQAVDDAGLKSEPDYLNVLLRPSSRLAVSLRCTTCTGTAEPFAASEQSTLELEALVQRGAVGRYSWSATLERNPADTLTGEPEVRASDARATIVLPAVARDARLNVVLVATGTDHRDTVARLAIDVRNDVDEPPVITSVRWRQAGQQVDGDNTTVVLPGDALFVEAEAQDPNGDPTACRLQFSNAVPVHTVGTGCRQTVYPLGPGALGFTATPENTGKP